MVSTTHVGIYGKITIERNKSLPLPSNEPIIYGKGGNDRPTSQEENRKYEQASLIAIELVLEPDSGWLGYT